MSEGNSSQNHVPSLQRCRRLRGEVVATLWGLAVLWVIIGPFTGDHSNATSRCMQNVALLLVAAACTTLMIWLMQYLVIEPRNKNDRSFELGYHAGRADALAEMRPSLGVVVPLPDRHGHTGT